LTCDNNHPLPYDVHPAQLEGVVIMPPKRHGLAAARKAAGHSQESLAERLGVERTTIQRWEAGETAPQPWHRPRLAKALGLPSDQLAELLDNLDRSQAQQDDRLSYALRHPNSADLVAVAQLREQVHELDVRYDRMPSTSLLAETGHCLGQAAFLRAYSSSSRVRRELFAVEAEGATLMGQLVWDASQRRDHCGAHAYFDQAIEAARQARDPAAEGLALLRKSFVALYGEKDPLAGLRLTLQTAETTTGVSSVLTGLALLHQAEARAMIGDRRDCERALAAAESCFDQISRDDAAVDLFSVSQPGRLAGSCYLFLGQADQAELILEATALELRDRSKSQAIVLGNLSLAYIRQGKLDEAAGMLHQAIDIVELTWGGGGLNIVFGACRELQPWRQVQAVQDVYDRVLALMAAA
jgi:transcriptional regulator with XRE-family HTH domain